MASATAVVSPSSSLAPGQPPSPYSLAARPLFALPVTITGAGTPAPIAVHLQSSRAAGGAYRVHFKAGWRTWMSDDTGSR